MTNFEPEFNAWYDLRCVNARRRLDWKKQQLENYVTDLPERGDFVIRNVTKNSGYYRIEALQSGKTEPVILWLFPDSQPRYLEYAAALAYCSNCSILYWSLEDRDDLLLVEIERRR